MYPNRWVFSVAVRCSVQVSPSARMFHGLFLMAEVAQCSVPMLTGPYRLYAVYILFTSTTHLFTTLCCDCVCLLSGVYVHRWFFFIGENAGWNWFDFFLASRPCSQGVEVLACAWNGHRSCLIYYRWSKISPVVVTARSNLLILIQHHWQVLVVKIGHWSWTDVCQNSCGYLTSEVVFSLVDFVYLVFQMTATDGTGAIWPAHVSQVFDAWL